MAIIKDKTNLPLNNSLMLIRKIQLSPKSPLTTISDTHLVYRYKKGLSKPNLFSSAAISSKVICEPCVFLKARYRSAQVPGTNSIKEKTIKQTMRSVTMDKNALVTVN